MPQPLEELFIFQSSLLSGILLALDEPSHSKRKQRTATLRRNLTLYRQSLARYAHSQRWDELTAICRGVAEECGEREE